MTKLIISTLATAIALSSVSTTFAAPKQGQSFQQCMAQLQASGRHFGGNSEETGMTAYDEMAARCIDQVWRQAR